MILGDWLARRGSRGTRQDPIRLHIDYNSKHREKVKRGVDLCSAALFWYSVLLPRCETMGHSIVILVPQITLYRL